MTDDRYLNAAQDPWELNELLSLIRRYRIRRVLEIGTKAHGWIDVVAPWTAPGCRFVAIDIDLNYGGEQNAVASRVKRTGRSLDFVLGDSATAGAVRHAWAAVEPRGYDLLHIDGDHSYESCRGDYERYSRMVRRGGLVVFHDVRHARDVGVHRFWDELHRRNPTPFSRSWAFFHWRPCTPQGDGPMGIGVIEVGQP